MGYRMHVVQKVEKMADYEAPLSYCEEQVNSLFDALDVERHSYLVGDEMARFEIKRDVMKNAVNALENIENGKEPGESADGVEIDKEEVLSCLEELGLPIGIAITMFKDFLKLSDQESEWINIVWY